MLPLVRMVLLRVVSGKVLHRGGDGVLGTHRYGWRGRTRAGQHRSRRTRGGGVRKGTRIGTAVTTNAGHGADLLPTTG
jgi:hypothetical protein